MAAMKDINAMLNDLVKNDPSVTKDDYIDPLTGELWTDEIIKDHRAMNMSHYGWKQKKQQWFPANFLSDVIKEPSIPSEIPSCTPPPNSDPIMNNASDNASVPPPELAFVPDESPKPTSPRRQLPPGFPFIQPSPTKKAFIPETDESKQSEPNSPHFIPRFLSPPLISDEDEPEDNSHNHNHAKPSDIYEMEVSLQNEIKLQFATITENIKVLHADQDYFHANDTSVALGYQNANSGGSAVSEHVPFSAFGETLKVEWRNIVVKDKEEYNYRDTVHFLTVGGLFYLINHAKTDKCLAFQHFCAVRLHPALMKNAAQIILNDHTTRLPIISKKKKRPKRTIADIDDVEAKKEQLIKVIGIVPPRWQMKDPISADNPKPAKNAYKWINTDIPAHGLKSAIEMKCKPSGMTLTQFRRKEMWAYKKLIKVLEKDYKFKVQMRNSK